MKLPVNDATRTRWNYIMGKRRSYPFWCSTAIDRPRPEYQTSIIIRVPCHDEGFALWGFRTREARDAFIVDHGGETWEPR